MEDRSFPLPEIGLDRPRETFKGAIHVCGGFGGRLLFYSPCSTYFVFEQQINNVLL